jgi:hypothetical protein
MAQVVSDKLLPLHDVSLMTDDDIFRLGIDSLDLLIGNAHVNGPNSAQNTY